MARLRPGLPDIIPRDEPGSIEHEILTQMSESTDKRVAWRANEALDFYR